MTEQTMKLTWLGRRQSIRDYISTRRAENGGLSENRAKKIKTRELVPQIARKTATRERRHPVQPWTPQRRHLSISRMTPAPPDRSYEQEIRMPGWGNDESEADEPPSSAKRSREPEPAPRFIDLRAVQFRGNMHGQLHYTASPSRRRFAGRKEAREVEELTRRVGQGSQKKITGERVAYKSVSTHDFSDRNQGQEVEQLAQRAGPNLATSRRGAALKSISSSFQMHMATATQMRPEELGMSARPIHSKSALPQRARGIRSSARKIPAIPATMQSDDEVEFVLSFSSDTEEIDELDSSSSDAEPPPPTGRARKMPSRSSPSVDEGNHGMPSYRSQPIQDSSSEDEEEGMDRGHTVAPLQYCESSPAANLDERITTPTVEPEPIIQLFRAFQLHTLPTDIFQEAKQLPFLTRNLRQSFQSLCHNLGIPVTPFPHDQQGTVLVRYEHVANASFERSVPKWFCPLCNLLGRLATREMLTIHLKTYHREIYTEWLQPTDNELREDISWRLHILIPQIDENRIDHAFPSPAPEETVEPELETADLHTPPEPEEPQQRIEHTPATPPRTPAARRDSFMLLFDERASVSPRSRLTAPVISPKGKGKEPTTARQFKPRPPLYPRPPPSSNRLGAAARPPYLPAKSTFGGPDIYYSTRFSGPCLFDLLNLLPLEPFGVFDGMVIDREEEIYNDDELAQEEKVIVALWARWIMLNKVEFDQDRAGGVEKFIDEYWKMIHLAAGWEALVYQLLVLAAWRLLRHYEIIPLLERYEELAGMQYWDEWDSNEE